MMKPWGVGICFFLLLSSMGFAGEAKRSGFCKRFLLATVISTQVLVGAPTVYHNVSAHTVGMEHIGHGIYLDMPEIIASLTPAEQQLVRDPVKNRDAVVTLFNAKLKGDYKQNPFLSVFPEPRPALQFLQGHAKYRGVCRHKAAVLAAILNHLGIRAQLETGSKEILSYKWHVWVYLPDTDQVVDPTNGFFMSAKKYYATHYPFHVRTRLFVKGWY